MDLLYIIDLLGTMVFAISGVLTAADHRMDLLGASVLGTVTAIGGGTIRDLMIGATPVGWLQDKNYFIVILLGIFIAVVFRRHIHKFRKTMFLFDTIGISLFTVIGVQKTMGVGLSDGAAIIMGAVSACFGGVVRDVLANNIPLIFRKDFYATVCLIGGLCYVLLSESALFNQDINTLATIVVIIVIRLLAVKFHWRLPNLIPHVQNHNF